ncbi:MAG TPA: hypothetical protein VM032_15890 [Vicinamibacterales bacterium]|nr:hypothetical protein [Vicinamibacterales bacterium]
MERDSVVAAVAVIVTRVAGPARALRGPDERTRLAEDCWLDSMELLEVVLECERHFGIAFEEAIDLVPANLATIGSLAAVVHGRLSMAGGPG